MRIVFIGAPGAGKGTQATKLAEFLTIPHLSTGEILRAAKKAGTELGRLVAPIMASGGLVSDEMMLDVVKERLAADDCCNGYLLDGFPRTIPQAEAYQQFLTDRQEKLDHVIELSVGDEELTRRLESRYHQLEEPRPEDLPEAIPHRLQLYHSQTKPLLDFYRQFDGVVISIDGVGDVDDVFGRVIAAIHKS